MTEKHYPVVGVGALVEHNAKVLLVKRGEPPYKGLWCIPGGKVHFGESLQEAAEREILEETGIVIKAGDPIFSFDIIDTANKDDMIHYVVVDLIADYVSGEIRSGSDALEVAWVDIDNIENFTVQETTRQLLERWWNSSK